MDLLTLLIVILIIGALFGGPRIYRSPGNPDIVGVVVTILLVVLLVKLLRVL